MSKNERSTFLQDTTAEELDAIERQSNDVYDGVNPSSSAASNVSTADEGEEAKVEEEDNVEEELNDDSNDTTSHTNQSEEDMTTISNANLSETSLSVAGGRFQRRRSQQQQLQRDSSANTSEGSSSVIDESTYDDSEGRTSTIYDSEEGKTMSYDSESLSPVQQRDLSEQSLLRHVCKNSAIQLEDLVDSAMLESGDSVRGQNLEVDFAESDPDMLVGFDSERRRRVGFVHEKKNKKHHADSDSDDEVMGSTNSISEEEESYTSSSTSKSAANKNASSTTKNPGVPYNVQPEQHSARYPPPQPLLYPAKTPATPTIPTKGTLLVGFEGNRANKAALQQPMSKCTLSQQFSSSLQNSGLLDIIEEDDEEEGGLFEQVDKELNDERQRRLQSASMIRDSSSRSIGSGGAPEMIMKKPASFRSFKQQSSATSVLSSLSNVPNTHTKSIQRKVVIMFGMLLVILASLTFVAIFLTGAIRQGQQQSTKFMTTGGMFEHSSSSSSSILDPGMYQFDNGT